uniref:Reverse transcriptase domain-containing protein n=1 Tax=Tanacetum cinerariifolium TaxID=118510 RepID=A0A6L2NCP1_TANCI|nr:reverse transcriptase domain-containing protein [Tanacetum cinerariifolium]
MKDLCQPTIDGRGGPIAPMTIQATDFRLKNHMIQQVQQSCQYHSLLGDDANKHIDKFLTVTQRIKENGVPHDVMRLCLFPYSLTHHATAWFDRLPKNSIHSWEEMLTKNIQRMSQSSQPVHVVSQICETCGGPHPYYECKFAGGFTQEDVYAATGNYNGGEKQQGVLPSNTITNPGEDLKVITTLSGMTFIGPSVPPFIPHTPFEEVERVPKTTMDHVHISSLGSTTHVPPLVIPPVSASKQKEIPELNPHQPLIPYPSSLVDALAQMLKYAKMLKDLLTNMEKLLELANTPLNKNCLVVLLNKLSEKLRDPGKFLIPYCFKELEVDKFTFLADFVVVDYDVDLYVLLILGRPFLRMAKALVDKSIHPSSSSDPLSGSPTPSSDHITVSSSPSFTPFGDSEFLLEEITAEIGLEDLIPSRVDDGVYDSRGDIIYLEQLLNEDPLSDLLSKMINHNDFKQDETQTIKSFIEDPLDLELKDLPPHLEYAFLEETLKLPFIIAKNLREEEKDQLLKLLKSHKTFTYRMMPFGLCNAPRTFQRCLVAIFHDMIEKTIEVFMDDFSVFEDSFSSCLSHLDKMLQRCKDTNLVLNCEKCHFMVKEGIVLDHKISKSEIKFDKAKVDVTSKLSPPMTVKGIRSFLGRVGFYRRFIQDFSKIAWPMTHLLERETSFIFSKECMESFGFLKKKLTEAPILVAPDWDLLLEIMTLSDAQAHYTTTKKELLAVVYAFEKFKSYLVLSKTIVYTDHSALKYLFYKQDAKSRLIRWILLFKEFDIDIRDKKRAKNLAADHLSSLENPHQGDLIEMEINDNFPHKSLKIISIKSNDEPPWFADIANYLVIIRRCMDRDEAMKILHACHHGPTRGHHRLNYTAKKVFDSGFYWPTIYYGAHDMVKHCDACEHRAKWADKLHDALWAFRTAFKTPIGSTSYSKLKSHWTGPFNIAEVFPYGTIELSQPNGPNFKVNGHPIKLYHRGDIQIWMTRISVSTPRTNKFRVQKIENGAKAENFERESIKFTHFSRSKRSPFEHEHNNGKSTEKRVQRIRPRSKTRHSLP